MPINDIIADKKKISGSAQTRRAGVLLQHGTVLYNLETAKMFSLLKISAEKISDKLIKGAEERVTCVSRYSGITLEGCTKSLWHPLLMARIMVSAATQRLKRGARTSLPEQFTVRMNGTSADSRTVF